jgi:hypothetical protein
MKRFNVSVSGVLTVVTEIAITIILLLVMLSIAGLLPG